VILLWVGWRVRVPLRSQSWQRKILGRLVFEVEYVDEHGQRCREVLAACWQRRFELAAPSRGFAVYRGQRSFSGWWWAATTGGHVAYESWLERSAVMRLDHDPRVVGLAAQPFWLHWHDGQQQRRHAPDYFVRRGDGTGVVVDVRADDRIKAIDAEAFAATATACAQVGWEFVRLGAAPAVTEANLRWLAGYRHPRCWRQETAAALVTSFAAPRGLLDGVRVVGEQIAVLPVAFHLLWRQLLTADLAAAPLGPSTMVQVPAGATR
jgi:hypothetical protein